MHKLMKKWYDIVRGVDGFYVIVYDLELADLLEDYLVERCGLVPPVRMCGDRQEFHFDFLPLAVGAKRIDEVRLKAIMEVFSKNLGR